MKITLFSIEQANQTMRAIRPHVEMMMAYRRAMVELEKRLEIMPLALAGASSENPDNSEAHQLERQRAEVAGKIRKELEAVHAKGCVVKDVDKGLVDFYSMAGDRLIFLCWQHGEHDVSHWHTLEGGFGTRQPLDKIEDGS